MTTPDTARRQMDAGRRARENKDAAQARYQQANADRRARRAMEDHIVALLDRGFNQQEILRFVDLAGAVTKRDLGRITAARLAAQADRAGYQRSLARAQVAPAPRNWTYRPAGTRRSS